MAKIVEVELVAKTDGAVAGVKKVDDAIKKTGNSAKKTSKDISAFSEGGKQLVSALDRQTGGLASKFVAVGKAAKLSGKAMKTALISSGIGAAVVAIGLLVEHWDAISEALGFVNKDLEEQADQLNKNIALNDEQLKSLDNQEQILILQGKSTGRIKEDKKKILLLQQEENKLLLENYKTQLLKEQQQQLELDWWDKLKVAVANASGIAGQGAIARAKSFEKSAEQIEKLAEIQKLVTDAKTRDEQLTIKLLQIEKKAADEKIKSSENAAKLAEEAEKARIDAIERIRKGLIDTEAEERAEKLRLIKEDYNQQIALAAEFYGANSIKILELKAAQKLAEDEQQAVFDEQDKARKEKIAADEKAAEDKRLDKIQENADKEAKIAEALNEQKSDLLNANLNNIAGGFALLGQLAGKNKALQAAAIIGESAVGIAKSVIDTTASNVAITAQGAALAIPSGGTSVTAAAALVSANNIMSGIGIATNIASTAKALSALKAGGAPPSPTSTSIGGGGGTQPPAFNIVGSSGETQLADAIGGQTQRPARAYVVSNDVTTAQEMDRNIIEGASIG